MPIPGKTPTILSSTARADAIISPDHPFRQHLKRVDAAGPHPAWTPPDGPMPALFLGHGAPRTFENLSWMGELHDWAHRLPQPTAILIVSAHWDSAPLAISGSGATELVYDFGGFDPMYYRMRYDTPDAGSLARRLDRLLPGLENTGRGLDHGAWVPLKVMYPAADIPVLQLSIPTHDAARLLDLGRRLRPLREVGVLVIGSGFMTHGLPFLTRDMIEHNKVPGWSADFDAWAADALAHGDVDEALLRDSMKREMKMRKNSMIDRR